MGLQQGWWTQRKSPIPLRVLYAAFLHREAGFGERLEEAGFRDIYAWDLNDTPFHAEHLPVALFAMSDQSALRAVNVLLEAGYRIPEDIAVLGVDDDDLVNVISPVELSSIRLATDRIGFAACEWLEAPRSRSRVL